MVLRLPFSPELATLNLKALLSHVSRLHGAYFNWNVFTIIPGILFKNTIPWTVESYSTYDL